MSKPKHIYLFSPSGAVRDPAAFRRGVRRLQALGHEVEIDPDALARHQRFAGDDATRLAAIHRAAASGADVALITRGGYGLTRILPGVRYRALARAVEKGMAFVGYSDFTVLQLALLKKTGATTWAGPALCDGFGARIAPHDGPDAIMEDCFGDLLQGRAEGTGWRQARVRVASTATDATAEEFQTPKATLWGGNLSLVCGLLGTPYFPDVRAGILFLEDVGEHPYRIERMLTQLLYAGVLARQRAVVLGQFTDYRLDRQDRGFKFDTVVQWLRAQVKTPVFTNLPFGHVPTKVLLPVGAKVELVAQGREVFLLWG